MSDSISDLLNDIGTFPSSSRRSYKRTVPYPQANSISAIIRIILFLKGRGTTNAELVSSGIVKSPRQASYYYDAVDYLGFCYKKGLFYYPTDSAIEIQVCPAKILKGRFAAMILSRPDIYEAYSQVFLYPTLEERRAWLESTLEELVPNQATRKRRASCMLAWLSWIQKNLPEI